MRAPTGSLVRGDISTERLRLRPLAMGDAPLISRFTSDPAVSRNLAMVPSPNPVFAVEGWIMTLAARAPLGGDHVRAIELKGEGLIGVIGAHARGGAVEIGYWLGQPFWGRGYATEALQAWVGAVVLLGALEAGHFIDNPASGRVLEKAGFAYSGETRAMFSLARGQSVACRRMAYAGEEASNASWAVAHAL